MTRRPHHPQTPSEQTDASSRRHRRRKATNDATVDNPTTTTVGPKSKRSRKTPPGTETIMIRSVSKGLPETKSHDSPPNPPALATTTMVASIDYNALGALGKLVQSEFHNDFYAFFHHVHDTINVRGETIKHLAEQWNVSRTTLGRIAHFLQGSKFDEQNLGTQWKRLLREYKNTRRHSTVVPPPSSVPPHYQTLLQPSPNTIKEARSLKTTLTVDYKYLGILGKVVQKQFGGDLHAFFSDIEQEMNQRGTLIADYAAKLDCPLTPLSRLVSVFYGNCDESCNKLLGEHWKQLIKEYKYGTLAFSERPKHEKVKEPAVPVLRKQAKTKKKSQSNDNLLMEFVRKRYGDDIHAFFTDLDTNVNLSSNPTSYAQRYAVANCPGSVSMIKEICCALRDETIIHLPPWWKRQISEYKAKMHETKPPGHRVQATEKARHVLPVKTRDRKTQEDYQFIDATSPNPGALNVLLLKQFQGDALKFLEFLDHEILNEEFSPRDYALKNNLPKSDSTFQKVLRALQGEKTSLGRAWRVRIARYLERKRGSNPVPIKSDSASLSPVALAKDVAKVPLADPASNLSVSGKVPPLDCDSLPSDSMRNVAKVSASHVRSQPTLIRSTSTESREAHPATMSPLSHEHTAIRHIPNAHASIHAELNYTRRFEPVPAGMVSWKVAVLLAVLVFLALCGPVALFLAVNNRYKVIRPPIVNGECVATPPDTRIYRHH